MIWPEEGMDVSLVHVQTMARYNRITTLLAQLGVDVGVTDLIGLKP